MAYVTLNENCNFYLLLLKTEMRKFTCTVLHPASSILYTTRNETRILSIEQKTCVHAGAAKIVR